MPYGTMSKGTETVLKNAGFDLLAIAVDYAREFSWYRVDIVCSGALDESFNISPDADASAIVDAIFADIESAANVDNFCVDAYETNGDDYNERIYVRESD